MSTLNRLEDLEKKVNDLTQLFFLTKDRIIALDHAALAQAKTLAAVAKVLGNQTPNFSNDVMVEIRASEDAEDAARTKSMVEAGFLKTGEVAGPVSVVALKQSQNGNVLMSYYTVSLNNTTESAEIGSKLQGLKAGDTFSDNGFDFEVLEVFEPVTPSEV